MAVNESTPPLLTTTTRVSIYLAEFPIFSFLTIASVVVIEGRLSVTIYYAL